MPISVTTFGGPKPPPGFGPDLTPHEYVAYGLGTALGMAWQKVLKPIAKKSPIGFVVSLGIYLATKPRGEQQLEDRGAFILGLGAAQAAGQIAVEPMWARDP